MGTTTSTAEMGNEGLVGTMSLKVSGASGDTMEVTWLCGLNLVSELMVGSDCGPWYIARHIPMASHMQATDQRILTAARHFLQLAGELSSMPSSPRELWSIFKMIWDYLEVDAPLA